MRGEPSSSRSLVTAAPAKRPDDQAVSVVQHLEPALAPFVLQRARQCRAARCGNAAATPRRSVALSIDGVHPGSVWRAWPGSGTQHRGACQSDQWKGADKQ